MACVLLSELPIIIPTYTIDLGCGFALLARRRMSILSYYYRVIVTA
jgi:hypothetical protein